MNQSATNPKDQFIRDLSGQYGQQGSTIYRKSDNYAFSEPQPFLNEVGAKDFNGLKFDTAYDPSKSQGPTFGLGDGQRYDINGNPAPTSQPSQLPTQPKQTLPVAASEDKDAFLRSLANNYYDSLKPSAETTANQQQYNNLIASRDLGIANIENKPIPMNFIVGQKENLMKNAGIQTQIAQRALEMSQNKELAGSSIARERLNFESGLADKAYEREQDAYNRKLTEEQQFFERNLMAQQFALENNIQAPFY